MNQMRPNSLRKLVTVVGLLAAVTTGVSVPLGYFVEGYNDAASLSDFKADLNARTLAKYIYTHDRLWQYQSVRLAELLTQTNTGHSRKRIVDADGKLVFGETLALAPPVLTRSAPIEVAGSTVGRLEISTSLRPLVHETGFVAILSTLLGLGVFFAVRIFPLRVLDRTLGTLERKNQQFDAALNNMSQGLCMFDSAERLIVCNDRYLKMYDLSRDIVQPGCTLSELLKKPRRTRPSYPESRSISNQSLRRLETRTDGQLDRRNRGWTGDFHHQLSDAEWRLGCHPRRHHGTPRGAGQNFAYGAP